MSKPILGDHLNDTDLAAEMGRCRMTIRRWTELSDDPLPYVRLPNGSKIFNIEKVRAWLARREHGGLPSPRRRGRRRAAS